MSPKPLTDLHAALGEQLPGYSLRVAQQAMAELVGSAIEAENHALIEAGTGIGKTFAYLLPALSSAKKVIISTGTKNLQDQLFYSDIPILNAALGRRIAMLKGRNNYVCKERVLKHSNHSPHQLEDSELQELMQVRDWLSQTKDGDLTEVIDVNQSGIVNLVSSTADNCLGAQCTYFDDCALFRARDKARQADVVVVNHHLLFADAAMKEESLGQLLPEAGIIILDEAHQVPDTAQHFYGERLGSRQLSGLLTDIEQEQLLLNEVDPLLKQHLNLAAESFHAFTRAIRDASLPLDRLLSTQQLHGVIDAVDLNMDELVGYLSLISERSHGLLRCYQRALKLLDLFTLLTTETDNQGFAHWLELTRQGFIIHLTPLSVAEHLAPLFERKHQSWILVSATLTVGSSFDHIRQRLGLSGSTEATFESPFSYLHQVGALVPFGLPQPGDDRHTVELVRAVLPFLHANNGRTFMLFTSHRAMNTAARLLNEAHDLVFVTQGALPKKRLLERFRELPRCILLATHSFWEGVDVRGADMRCLVIDKLPFSSPDNPLVRAHMNWVAEQGGNGFVDFSLPEAIITLKQGFGRLVRQESDYGLFILGDPRVFTKGYGTTIRASLPTMQWHNDSETAMNQFREMQVEYSGR